MFSWLGNPQPEAPAPARLRAGDGGFEGMVFELAPPFALAFASDLAPHPLLGATDDWPGFERAWLYLTLGEPAEAVFSASEPALSQRQPDDGPSHFADYFSGLLPFGGESVPVTGGLSRNFPKKK